MAAKTKSSAAMPEIMKASMINTNAHIAKMITEMRKVFPPSAYWVMLYLSAVNDNTIAAKQQQ